MTEPERVKGQRDVITTTVTIETIITIVTADTEAEEVGQIEAPESFENESQFATWLTAHPALWGDTPDDSDWISYGDPDFGSSDMYEIAIFCEREQDQEDVEGLVGYFVEGPFAGEFSSDVARTEHPYLRNRVFRFYVDFTKSRRDDVLDVLPGLWDMLSEGTPIRKTDRVGSGTKGTRKYEGLDGEYWLAFR